MIERALGGCLLTTALFAAGCAHAGLPFVTDDPEPVKLHAWEINTGWSLQRSGDVRSGAAPGVDINYGAFTNVQLHAQPQLAWVRDKHGSTIGVGDLELGVKYRMTASDAAPEALMVGIYPMLQLPTGNADKGLGAGAHSLYLPLWLQTSRDAWTVYGGAGYRIDCGVGAKNAWAGGVTVLRAIDERLQVGAELFGSTTRQLGERGTLGFNLGAIYALDHGMALLLSAGRGVGANRDSNQASAYLGVRVSL